MSDDWNDIVANQTIRTLWVLLAAQFILKPLSSTTLPHLAVSALTKSLNSREVLLMAWIPIWRSRSRMAGSAEASAMERCNRSTTADGGPAGAARRDQTEKSPRPSKMRSTFAGTLRFFAMLGHHGFLPAFAASVAITR